MAKKKTVKKTSLMADEVANTESQENQGEQMEIPGIRPENMKELDAQARIYNKAKLARMSAGNKEVEEKQKVFDLIKKAKLKPTAKGKIVYKHEDIGIEVTPTEFKLKVTVKDE